MKVDHMSSEDVSKRVTSYITFQVCKNRHKFSVTSNGLPPSSPILLSFPSHSFDPLLPSLIHCSLDFSLSMPLAATELVFKALVLSSNHSGCFLFPQATYYPDTCNARLQHYPPLPSRPGQSMWMFLRLLVQVACSTPLYVATCITGKFMYRKGQHSLFH